MVSGVQVSVSMVSGVQVSVSMVSGGQETSSGINSVVVSDIVGDACN